MSDGAPMGAIEKRRRVRRLAVIWPGLGVAAIVMLAVAFRVFYENSRRPSSDFMTFRASGVALLNGSDLYGITPPQIFANLNPPFATLLFVPLAAMPVSAALVCWGAFIVACLLGAAVVMTRTLRQPFLLIAPLVVLFHPTIVAVAVGQMGIPLLLVLTLAWSADRRQAARLTGLAIGVAVALKMFMAVILVSLCIRRQWRTLAWSAAGAGIATAIGLLLVGLDGYRGWLGALQTPHVIEFPSNASLLGLFRRRVADPWLANALWMIAATILGLATVALLWRVRDDTDRSWGIASAAAILLSPLGWIYYFPILTPALVALWTRGSRIARLALVLLMVPVIQSQPFAAEWLTGTLVVSLIACAAGSPPARQQPQGVSTISHEINLC